MTETERLAIECDQMRARIREKREFAAQLRELEREVILDAAHLQDELEELEEML